MRTTSFSLTPGFGWVVKCLDLDNRFNGLPHPAETVETDPVFPGPISTQLKQGVTERDLNASSFDYEISGLRPATIAKAVRERRFVESGRSFRMPGTKNSFYGCAT